MKIKDIRNKIKTTIAWVRDNKIVTVILISTTIIVIAMFSGGKIFTDVDTQEQIIIKEKDARIEELNKEIEELQKQNLESAKRYVDIKNKLAKLEKDKQSIEKPEGANEIKNRFHDLGYSPI